MTRRRSVTQAAEGSGIEDVEGAVWFGALQAGAFTAIKLMDFCGGQDDAAAVQQTANPLPAPPGIVEAATENLAREQLKREKDAAKAASAAAKLEAAEEKAAAKDRKKQEKARKQQEKEAKKFAAREEVARKQAAEAQKALDGQLWGAAEKGDAAAIERLVAEGASPNAKSGHFGAPAVVEAAINGHAGAVSALVRLGADPDARDSDGWTALMWTAYKDQVEIARALLAGGADRTLRATDGYWKGKTALEMAEKEGKAKVAALLRECGS
eukprot:COSAG04_NODE_57_length_30587_cov_86.784632_33_plen_269_part_00